MVHVALARQQGVDHPAALQSGWRTVRQKCPRLFRGGKLPRQILGNAAQEGRVVRRGGGLDPEPLQFRVDQLIDVVVLWQGFPDETRLRIQHRDRHRPELALIADQHGGLADARAFHDSVGRNVRRVRNVARNHRLLRDIPNRAVQIVGHHADLLFQPRLRHFHGRRLHLDALHLVFRGVAERHALRNPVENGLIILRARLDAQPAPVRHFLGGLGEHQAAARIGPVEAASGKIVEQRLVVEFRVVTAQRELEAVLAFGRSVTGARRAADLVEDRRDIAQECDLFRPLGKRKAERGKANCCQKSCSKHRSWFPLSLPTESPGPPRFRAARLRSDWR